MRSAFLFLSLGALAPACGGVSGNIGGTLNGAEWKPRVGYWGGPFLVFSEDDIDCIDLWWVSKDYDDTNPWDRSFDVLQVTFEDSEVVKGSFEMSGTAPVWAGLISGDGEDLAVDEARSGQVIIDGFTSGQKVKGSLSLEMVAGSVTGDFKIQDCANLSSSY